MTRIYTLLILLVAPLLLCAQQSEKNLIVNVQDGKLADFIEFSPSESRQSNSIKILSKELAIVKVSASEPWLNFISKSKLVESWGYDKELTLRGTPNDAQFGTQWGLRLIDAELAWNNNTGGLFDGQHEVVIAVLDDGFDMEHSELQQNIFTNNAEIPNNGIDDDGNGYVDDYRGLNIETGDDKHTVDDHGTAVAGIIGAEGNNSEGLAGVMWNTKMLMVSEVSRQSELIETFQYLVDLRRKWNDSQGAEGAFIVATNYSAGIDNAFGSDPEYVAWCDMYDLLGEVGIISAGATTNANTNVDLDGDMPSTCESDFLTVVTNVTFDDEKPNGAGYGPIHVDLGAPGGTDSSPMPVLDVDNTFGSFNGTSSATPHVAGTIGLLYGVNCQSFIDEVYSNPSRAARSVIDAIHSSTDRLTALDGITTTNGRLNANKAIEHLLSGCDKIASAIGFNEFDFSPDVITIEYFTDGQEDYRLALYNIAGSQVMDMPLLDASSGSNIITIDRIDLATGIYIFSIYNDKEISSKMGFIPK